MVAPMMLLFWRRPSCQGHWDQAPCLHHLCFCISDIQVNCLALVLPTACCVWGLRPILSSSLNSLDISAQRQRYRVIKLLRIPQPYQQSLGSCIDPSALECHEVHGKGSLGGHSVLLAFTLFGTGWAEIPGAHQGDTRDISFSVAFPLRSWTQCYLTRKCIYMVQRIACIE